MQRDRARRREARRRWALALASWLALAGSLLSAGLAVAGWLDAGRRSPSEVAPARAAAPAAARTPPSAQAQAVPAPSRAAPIVAGVLRTPRGEPIASEVAELRSRALGTRLEGVSDEAGAFSIAGARVGSVYELVVRPRGPYADYRRHGIAIPAEGLRLDVVLEPLPTRRLAGRMVDAEGRPIPGFRLQLRGPGVRKESIEVRSDGAGRFEVDGVPSGRLKLAASGPLVVIEGAASVEVGATVDLVLDVGTQSIDGRVIDARGEPVAGAQLELVWGHRDGVHHVSSVRRGIADRDGHFRFDGLGPGPRRLTAAGAGESATMAGLNAGQAPVEIVLDRARFP